MNKYSFKNIYSVFILLFLLCVPALIASAAEPGVISNDYYAQDISSIEVVFEKVRERHHAAMTRALNDIEGRVTVEPASDLLDDPLRPGERKNPFLATSIDEVESVMDALSQRMPKTPDEILIQEQTISDLEQKVMPVKAEQGHFEQEKDYEEWEWAKAVEETKKDIRFKIGVGYMFMSGEHSFRLAHPSFYGNLSKLTYPMKGGMSLVKGEIEITPHLSVGGRYATSHFSKTTSQDEDWNFESGGIFYNYHLTEQDTKSKVYFWDLNVYHRLYNLEKEEIQGSSPFHSLFVDKMRVDGFLGYQYYRGRHAMVDPITKWEYLIGSDWWVVPTPLSSGLNSWYKVNYRGPRLGLRVSSAHTEKLSSSLSLSYAWLRTNANAFWNLRDFSWRHEGKGLGSAFNVDLEAEYLLTRHWFLGGGLHAMWQRHKKLLYSGTQPAGSFENLDMARDAKMHLFGFSLQAGYRW